MIYLNALALMCICVIIIDLTDATNTLTSWIKYVVTNGKFKTPMELKPLTCSFCMSHWVNVIYFLALGRFTPLNYLYILTLSLFTTVIRDLLIKIISTIQQWISN